MTIFVAISLMSCGKQASVEETKDKQKEITEEIAQEVVELIEPEVTYTNYDEISNKIMFVHQYTNWADGFLNYGYFVDKEGSKVTFDLSNIDEKYSKIDLLLTYLEEQDFENNVYAFETEDMKQYYDWLCKIKTKCSIEETCVAQDYGQVVLYGIRYPEGSDKPEIIKIHEQGDWIRVNTDEYAQKLSDVDELIEKWDLEHFGYSKEKKKFIEE